MNNPLTQPLPAHQRTPIIDVLRGWALLGVAIGNFAAFYHLGSSPEREKDTLTSVLEYVSQYLFSAKSWTLLSILFGYGFSILIRNIADKTGKPVSFFMRRMFWLLVLAFVNSIFFYGDILRDYALLGMLLLLFYRVPTKTVFRTSVLLMLIIPFVAAYVRNLGISYQAEAYVKVKRPQLTDWIAALELSECVCMKTDDLIDGI